MDISSTIRSQNLYRLSGSVNNISSNTKALHVDMKNIDTRDGAYLADSFVLDGNASLLGDVPDLRSIIKTVNKKFLIAYLTKFYKKERQVKYFTRLS